MSHREDDASLVRHEEELRTDVEAVEVGRVRAKKRVEAHPVQQTVELGVERADVERQAAEEGDSGEIITLPDGSVSIPLFEEELVVTKRLVVRERIVIRKHTVSEQRTVDAELRRERIEVERDGEVEITPAPAERP